MPDVSPIVAPKTIILLDLNYTLVANSYLKRQQGQMSYDNKIRQETYRPWLIELIRPYKVLLCTVRHERYRDLTLGRIFDLTGWKPDEAYFNPTDNYHGGTVKRIYLETHIFPKYGKPDTQTYFAVESAKETKAMYQQLGIASASVTNTPWASLPFTNSPQVAH